MRQWMKKCMAGVIALVMTAGTLTACEAYIPQTSGTDNASGAAVSKGEKKGQESGKKEEKKAGKTASLKYEAGGKYSDLIDLDMQSARAFYVVYRYRYASYCHIFQITPDGRKMKKTGIKSVADISLVSVDRDWIYYGIGRKIYRVPIVEKKKSESLDIEKKECVVKNCKVDAAFVDDQKLYYMTEENITASKKMVKEDIQIHCLNLVTGEERLCPKKILNSEDCEGYESGQEIECYPSYYITENYIYYMDFYPNKLYQLDKDTLELSVIDALEPEECEYGDYSLEIAENGAYIWYIKIVGEGKNEAYEICRYDVKEQRKQVVCTEEECLEVICKQENVNIKDIDYVDIEDIVHFDEDKLYIEYEVGPIINKKMYEYRTGVIVYSLSAGQMKTLPELCKYYRKHSCDVGGNEIESEVFMEGYLEKEQQFLLCVETGEAGEYDSWYAIYDMASKKIKKISDKKGYKLEKKIDKRFIKQGGTVKY